jgi:hypothetical protein
MNTSQNSTVEDFASTRARRRVALGVGIAVVLGGIALAWAFVPRPCDTLARDMWEGGGMVEASELASELRTLGITDQECTGALQAVDRAHPMSDEIARTIALRELLAGRTSDEDIDRLTRRLRRSDRR